MSNITALGILRNFQIIGRAQGAMAVTHLTVQHQGFLQQDLQ